LVDSPIKTNKKYIYGIPILNDAYYGGGDVIQSNVKFLEIKYHFRGKLVKEIHLSITMMNLWKKIIQ